MLDVVHALSTGVVSVVAWPVPLFVLLGVAIGTVVGLLPGLGAPAMLTLLIPFTIALDPLSAMALLMSAAAVTATTGDLSSILLGVPGEAVSAAIVVDGHALAKDGQAGRAMGAALMSSFMGAAFGVVAFILAVPIARPVLTSIGSPELFMLTMAGIAFIAPLVGTVPLKGLIAGAMGLLLATVGLDPADSTPRFTFGALFLWDGLGVLPVVLGLFAIPEALLLVSTRSTRTTLASAERGGVSRGMWDAVHRWALVLRCSAIGTYIGMLPGPGGSIAQWVAYAHARGDGRRTDGAIDGVIGPGAANNSTLGGALLPTLALGIPGSVTTAILMSALAIKGIVPGDSMLQPDAAGGRLNLVMAFMWIVVIANVLVVVSVAGFLSPLSRIANIRGTRLVPIVLCLTFVGAFMERNAVEDLLVVAASGCLGWMMLTLDWPRAPLLLGLILGSLAENRLFLSVSLYGWAWWRRPGVVLIGVGITVFLLAGLWRKMRAPRLAVSTPSPSQSPRGWRVTADLAFAASIFVVALAALWATTTFSPRATLFPRAIAGALCLLAMAQVVMEWRATTLPRHSPSMGARAPVWVAGFLAGIWTLGFDLGAPLVTILYLRFGARDTWVSAVSQSVAVALFVIVVIQRLLAVPLPPGTLRAFAGG